MQLLIDILHALIMSFLINFVQEGYFVIFEIVVFRVRIVTSNSRF